jgi:hypothetical protein
MQFVAHQRLRHVSTGFNFLFDGLSVSFIVQHAHRKYDYFFKFTELVFPATDVIALAFALIIVSTQSLRAAQANPVKSLRNE